METERQKPMRGSWGWGSSEQRVSRSKRAKILMDFRRESLETAIEREIQTLIHILRNTDGST